MLFCRSGKDIMLLGKGHQPDVCFTQPFEGCKENISWVKILLQCLKSKQNACYDNQHRHVPKLSEQECAVPS